MTISNDVALENLYKQRKQLLEQLRSGETTLIKLEGAIEVLEQLKPEEGEEAGTETTTDFGEEATLAGE